MKGEWKVTSQYIGDVRKYAVYRLIDADGVDHSGNREYATTSYMEYQAEADRIAGELNAKEKALTEGATCQSCVHFRGLGDWSLCCDIKHDLCYEDSPACGDFEPKEKAPNGSSTGYPEPGRWQK